MAVFFLLAVFGVFLNISVNSKNLNPSLVGKLEPFSTVLNSLFDVSNNGQSGLPNRTEPQNLEFFDIKNRT